MLSNLFNSISKATLPTFAGMLGVHFASDRESMIGQIPSSVAVFGHALDSLISSDELSDDEKRNVVQSNVSCQSRDEIK